MASGRRGGKRARRGERSRVSDSVFFPHSLPHSARGCPLPVVQSGTAMVLVKEGGRPGSGEFTMWARRKSRAANEGAA